MEHISGNYSIAEHWKPFMAASSSRDVFSMFKRPVANVGQRDWEVIEIPFEARVAGEIDRICNASPILVYHFYSTVLGILLSKYTEAGDVYLLSPAIATTGSRNSGYFFAVISVNELPSFKAVFSTGKEQLIDSIGKKISFGQLNAGQEATADALAGVGFSIKAINEEWEQVCTKVSIEIDKAIVQPVVRVRFNSGMYRTNGMELFALNLAQLLHEIVNHLYKPVADINYQSQKELQLLEQFNKPRNNFSIEKSIVQEIEEQVIHHANEPVIESGDIVLTYAQLNEKSNKLGRFLIDRYRLGKGAIAGVLMDRSELMAVSILAIWKTGAAYVPIDAGYPDERIKEIMTGASPVVVVGYDLQEERIKALASAETTFVELNDVWNTIENYDAHNIGIPVSMQDLAYIIFTSGTTGKPKGVMIEHAGMRNHIGAKIADLEIGGRCRIAQNAPQCFDISVWQFFAAPVCGGTTVVFNNEVIMEPAAFIEQLERKALTVLELVPSYFSVMLDVLEDTSMRYSFAHLTCIVLQAEPLLPSMVKRWYALYPHIPIFNAYGITEVSDDIAHYKVPPDLDTTTVPVAQDTIQNAFIYLVDETLRPVPIGAKGEIVVAGLCVGQGYYRDAVLTEKRFLNGSLKHLPVHERYYLSGDIARYLPDGRLEFFGRKDAQLKIRGQRVEPGEIEVVMSRIQGVEQAVVIGDNETMTLTAFYQSDPSVTAEQIEARLKETLPDYMVPGTFIRVNEFPLTGNGKIDRKKLWQHFRQQQDLFEPEAAILSEREQQVAGIWKALLNKNHIGVTDDFFQLGGHSLLLMKLLNIYQKEFNIKVPLRTLYERKNIREHAVLLDSYSKEIFRHIPVVGIQESYPVSDAQRRLWIISQFANEAIAYNISAKWYMSEKLDVESFEKAVKKVIQRHEILRTVFKTNDKGEVRQFILDEVTRGVVEYIDLQLNDDQEATVTKIWEQLRLQAFNLEEGPLLKMLLLQVNENAFLICLNIHHIICDGWSLEILIREVRDLYLAYLQDREFQLTPLPIQYKDYAVWQLDRIGQLDAEKKYWHEKLSGQLPVLEMPVNTPRGNVKAYAGKRMQVSIPEEVRAGMKAICDQYHCTLYTGLLTNVYGLLARYTGQEDLIVGCPVSGRHHADLHDQVGFYVNTLPLRITCNVTESFAALLESTDRTIVEAFDHQSYPFDLLVDDLKLSRNGNSMPLIDVMVGLQITDQRSNPEFSMGVENIVDTDVEAPLDLNILFNETSEGLSFYITYNTNLYPESSIKRMAAHLILFMEGAIQNIQTAIIDINYLGTGETEDVLQHSMASYQPATASKQKTLSVIDLFHQQVARTPQLHAVAFQKEVFTYAELNQRANKTAHYILQKTGGKNVPIGIYLERGMDYVCAILGILKAGACYLPLDILYPSDRINYLIQDSKTMLVISDKEGWSKLNIADEIIDCIILNGEEYLNADLPEGNPPIALAPADIAYIIYTSGTTGTPKGVTISHENVASLFRAADTLFDFEPTDVWTLFHSFSFDFSVWELFAPLVSGGKIIIIPTELAKDTEQFITLLETENVTILNQTPSAFYALTTAIEKSGNKRLSLRNVIFGGEALHPGKLLWWFNHYPRLRHINMYGITETTVHVTFKEISIREVTDNISSVGVPIPEWYCLVLDQNRQLVPVGIPGEMYVGGAGVAMGYHQREELTKEKFIEDPYNKGLRLYKTGDKAKWLENGELLYLGRIDQQVKIRGYRIETAEIENVLLGAALFSEVAVRACSMGGTSELAVYYVSAEPVVVAEVRNYLAKQLPAYMVPAYFIRLSALPLTNNGKLDEKKLPLVEHTDGSSQSTYIGPSNEVEHKLVSIWQAILGIEKIGIQDNFFDLGGHSLKATLLLAEIHKQFDIKLKLDQIFTTPFIEGIATAILNIQSITSISTAPGKKKIII